MRNSKDLEGRSTSAEASAALKYTEHPRGLGPEAERRREYLNRIVLARPVGKVIQQPVVQSKPYQGQDLRVDHASIGSVSARAQVLRPTGHQLRLESLSMLKIESLFSLAFSYFRQVAFICTVLFFLLNLGYISLAVAIGSPSKLPKAYVGMAEGVYQGFNCGWTTKVSNPYTCDKE